jgi:uncharacterized protein YkuJ
LSPEEAKEMEINLEEEGKKEAEYKKFKEDRIFNLRNKEK